MTEASKDDEDFLGYVEIHCTTERALFSGIHVRRLYELSGHACSGVYPTGWYSVHEYVAAPLIKAARLRLKEKEKPKVLIAEVAQELPLTAIQHDPSKPGLLHALRVRVGRSEHLVRVYDDRLAIHQGEGLSWEALDAIKCLLWGDDACAVEVYPPRSQVINEAPTRHLWRSSLVTMCVLGISNTLRDRYETKESNGSSEEGPNSDPK